MPVIDQQISIEIDEQQVFKDIGYDMTAKPSARISSLVVDYIENADTLFDPSYSYVVRDIDFIHDNYAFIESGVIFKSKVLACLLERCERIAIFALTIGKQLEEIVRQIANNGRVLQARVLDAIGSNAVEITADWLQEQIKREASREGMHISRRFSPGYCDWGINQQKMVFRAMEGDSAGIELTDGCLMVPRKSTSGIIGLGAAGKGIEEYNPCIACRKQDCPSRR